MTLIFNGVQCMYSLPTKIFHFPYCYEEACDAIMQIRHDKTVIITSQLCSREKRAAPP